MVPEVYAVLGDLPRGCTLCMRGLKVVVFITGLCKEKCFYCPVSPDKLYKDVKTVDEEPFSSLEDLIEEVYRVGADGAAITGGDPLLVLDRTVATISLLKEIFGDDFHIHLYTTGIVANSASLKALEKAGLDEIRFHVRSLDYIDRVKLAKRVLGEDVAVGVEVPVLPDHKSVEILKQMIKELDSIGVDFVNLNEAEVSPSNVGQVVARGYAVDEGGYVVKGSGQAALDILKWATHNVRQLSVHYCPARFKDRVQMRLRLLRKAIRTLKPYHRVTGEGLLEFLVVRYAGHEHLAVYGERIGDLLALPPDLAGVVQGGTLERVYPVSRRSSLSLTVERVPQDG
jgi:hypothetical protein